MHKSAEKIGFSRDGNPVSHTLSFRKPSRRFPDFLTKKAFGRFAVAKSAVKMIILSAEIYFEGPALRVL